MIGRRRVLQLGGAVAVGAAVGVASPVGDAAADSPETANAADIGFCTDMTAHHVQALVMCQRVLGRETGDPVQAAATEVLTNQAMEVGQMRAWLADWGESTATPEFVMGWMGMNDGGGMPLSMMPGLATADELQQLSRAEGLEQGRQWLVLMRAHHVGGVTMARAASELAGTEKVRRLAGAQADVQTYEISQYDALLASTYG